MFVLALSADGDSGSSHGGLAWGPDQRDELSRLAKRFKDAGDEGGVHLCALIEGDVKRYQEEGKSCPVEILMYLSIALMRSIDAMHEMAHIVYPGMAELIREAVGQAEADMLKNELGI